MSRFMANKARKVRVYELARDLGLPSQEVMRRLRARGVEASSHMASVDESVAAELGGSGEEDAGGRARNRQERAARAVRRRRAGRRKEQPKTPPRDRRPEADAGERPAPPPPERPRHRQAPREEHSPAAEPKRPPERRRPSAEAEPTPRREGAPDRLTPKERFEVELERARARTEARRREEEARRLEEEAERGQKERSRPEVGTVIQLPSRRLQVVERPAEQKPRRKKPRRKARKKGKPGEPKQKTPITTPAEHKRVLKLEDTVAITDLARAIGIKATELLKQLWSQGMTGVHAASTIDFDTAALIAADLGYEARNVAFHEDQVLVTPPDREEDLEPRAPVVTVMGHVDHGKTTLLDRIRNARVAPGEPGGITQDIAAYRVSAPGAGELVFLDTPGHEAFAAMRARGARATDLVVLLVAADDGVMPQSVEALEHAREAEVPIVVAVSKCDRPDARPEMVRSQLAELGLVPEEWGGDTPFVDVSAVTGLGIDTLLDTIGIRAELLELRASRKKPAVGVVIEGRLDRARGPVATVLVQQGILQRGDTLVSGEQVGRVRAMLDDRGRSVSEAGPSTPVEILGLEGVPGAGEAVHVTDEKTARRVAGHRSEMRRQRRLGAAQRLSLGSVLDRIRTGEELKLKIVLKADTQGAAEALRDALEKLATDQVGVDVVRAGVGGITESDLHLAIAGAAIVVGFRVRPTGKTAKLARQEGVEIRRYDVVYEALEDVERAMAGLLPPVRRSRELGRLEVRQVFRIPRVGTVAGCIVSEGAARRGAQARVVRDGVVIREARVSTLRRYKEDVTEVTRGYECGVTLEGESNLRPGDQIEVYEIVMERQALRG